MIDMVIEVKMKKSIFFIFAAVIMVSQLLFVNAKATGELALDDSVRLNDMVITLLMPSINNAVDSFYEPYLTIEPTVVPYYGTKIANIQGGEQIHKGIYNSHYTAIVDVFPYIGPHISVGKDRIELSIQLDGVTIKNYEHLENHELPPHLQDLIKKPLP